ncbi:hypothetical protein DESA109040_09615 [Deinococcus saxicola]|uniref:DUF3800 domain-containing protein n=1 Tax=Deinococcus saxicola TaxID=249406 RepID=UPI0039F0868C
MAKKRPPGSNVPVPKPKMYGPYFEQLTYIRPGRYHIYIDESENLDEMFYTISAVLIPERRLYDINRDVDKIRAAIGREMFAYSYPVYIKDIGSLRGSAAKSEARRMRAGALPEIHAQHIWQAGGAYQIKGCSEALKRRNKWLKSVADVFNNHEIYIMTRRFNQKLKPYISADPQQVIDGLRPYLTQDLSLQKVSDLYSDVQFRLVLETFIKLDTLSEIGVEIISINCDGGRRHELFSKFAGFDRARKFGYWSNFPNPIFPESHDVNGVQLADFSAYFFMRGHIPHDDDPIFKYINRAIYNRKVEPTTSFIPATPTKNKAPSRRLEYLMSVISA